MRKLLLLLATLAGTHLLCAQFVPPARDVLLFRRDALALDNNRQKLLAQDLIALATRPTAVEGTANRRATAQLLALAQNLDPSSNAPRNLARLFTNDEAEELIAEDDLEGPLQNLSSMALYLLETPDKPEHQEIAQLLLDPIATIAPDLTVVLARPSSEESERWSHVVAPLEKFVTKRRAPTPTPDTDEEDEMQTGAQADEWSNGPSAKENTEDETLLKVAPFSGALTVPVFAGPRSRSALVTTQGKLLALRFKGQLEENGNLSSFGSPDARHLETLLANLSKSYLPQNASRVSGRYRFTESVAARRNDDILTFPMTLLAEGLLSERQPLENLIVLGNLTDEGRINAPRFPWPFLQILLANEKKESSRLLVSAQLVPLLETFLTHQKEDCFFDYDIFAVETLEEAATLAFVGSTPAATAQALEKFQEIRQVGEGKKTSVFVANTHVMSRLDEVIALEPRFLSATLLRKRGKGDYPTKYSSEVLANLLQASLMPLTRLPYQSSRDLNSEELNQIHSECRAHLDPLARNVALSDRETYDQAIDLANRIRTLARAKARLDEEEYSGEDSFNTSLFFDTFQAIQLEYYELASKTARFLGQEPPAHPRGETP